MNTDRIDEIIETHKLPKFRSKQLKKAFFEQHCTSFDQVSTLSKDLRSKLSEENVLSLSLHKMYTSAEGNCFKALLKLHDDRIIETVLMSPKPGHWTTCISSQVGCALACTFCATGTMGLLRNLTSEEISDQVLFWKQFIQEEGHGFTLNNIVYMGMGEPLHNKKNVFASLRELTNPDTFNIGSRHISVSTSGMVQAIYEFSDEFPQVNLAISLHSADEDQRTSLMPINKKWSLADLGKSLQDYLDKTNRKIFIEYILLKNENDSLQDARKLVEFLKGITPTHLLHTNLIVYNETDSSHEQASRENARAFKEYLVSKGVQATIRKNLGRDIDGACGQLAVLDQK